MKALVYLLQRTVINYFKRLKQKPLKAVGPIFVVLWMTLMFLPNRKRAGSGGGISVDIFVTIFVLFILVMFLYSLYSATKGVTSKFDMSDVNLIFISPIRPQTVMLYGIIKKIALEFFASMYILYQIPNILKEFNIPGINKVLFFICYLFFQLVFCNILKLFIFAINTKNASVGIFIRNTIKGIILFAVMGIVYVVVTGNFITVSNSILHTITYSSWFGYVPLFGWMREMAFQTVTMLKLSYIIYLALVLLLCILLLYLTYNMELDFYEDMLSSAERNDILRNIKSGKKYSRADNRKSSKLFKPFRRVELKLDGVYGAKVIFFKHMNEYFKRSLIFFINTYSIVLLSASIIIGVFGKGVPIKGILIVASGLLFFSSGFAGKIYSEISYNFIFLLPDSPQRKLFYGTCSSFIKIFVDALILFIPFGILSRTSIIEVLLCVLCYVALGGMLSYSGLLAFRIAEFFGFTGAISSGVFFTLFQMLLVVPAAIIVIVSMAVAKNFDSYAIYIGLLIYELGAAALFSLGCVGIFNNMEIKE